MNEPAAIDNSTVLVTGASGFIGSHLVDHLLERGCTVHCLVRKTSNLQWLDSSRVHLHTVVLPQPDTYKDCVSEADYVFHCAGLTQALTHREYLESNARVCIPFYQACVDHGPRIKAVVHLSSLAAAGPSPPGQTIDENSPCQPLTYYGKSKLTGEEIALGFAGQLPIIVLRPPVVYGERETDFFTYLKALNMRLAIKVGFDKHYLSLIYVGDLVRAMVRAASAPVPDATVFFTTDGKIYSWEDLADAARQVLGKRAFPLVIPIPVMAAIAMVAEFWAQCVSKPPFLDRQRMKDLRQTSWTASSDRFFKHYSYEPQMDLVQGLTRTFAWYKKHGWL